MKAALFEGNEIREQEVFIGIDDLNFHDWLSSSRFDRAISLSVSQSGLSEKLRGFISVELLKLDKETALPFSNEYSSKETLGMDRIAAIAGAYSRFPSKPILVIDAGTAITYDFLTADARYLGGAISPGVQMRYRSLHEFTARLPLLQSSESAVSTELIGHDTVNSIHSGVLNGTASEIAGQIERFRHQYPECLVFLTGGDAPLFDGSFKSEIFAAPNLVLEGLNTILNYNAEKHS